LINYNLTFFIEIAPHILTLLLNVHYHEVNLFCIYVMRIRIGSAQYQTVKNVEL